MAEHAVAPIARLRRPRMPPSADTTRAAPTFVVPVGAPPVLHLDPPFVELGWQREGATQFLSATVEGDENEALVAAVRSLVVQAKLQGQGIVLGLAAPWFDSRQVLLANMPEDETHLVLSRRAANNLSVDLEESLFWAQRCESPLAHTDAAQTTWLVHAHRRSRHFDLLMRLRTAGIKVRRAVAVREVLTHCVQAVEGLDEDAGHIQVTSTGRAVYAHLFRGTHLVQESRLPLVSFDRREDTYTNVVQDVRQLTAFWSKGTRGAALQAVHLLGLAEADVAQLHTPLGIAAQGARVQTLGCPSGPVYRDVRVQLLQILMAFGLCTRDLALPLPPRRSRIAALALGLSAVAAVGAGMLLGHWSERIDMRTEEISWQLATAGLVERDQEARQAYVAARDSLRASITGLETLARRGVSLNDVVEHVHSTVGRVANLRQLSFEKTDAGTKVLIEASLDEEAESAARRLDELRRVIDLDPLYVDVVIEPASRVPDGDRGEALTFTFAGTFVGGSA